MARSVVTDVVVSRRVLWIGAEAYPLNNIARATTVKVDPPRRQAIARFVKSFVTVVVLAFLALVVLPNGYQDAAGLLAVVAIALLVVQLGGVILDKTYYALVIETAGTPNTALVTNDLALVHDLVRVIMEAIDNPQASFHQQVTNYIGQVGDNFKVFGSGNVGKVGN
ncbi:hypothetical protein EDE04_2310 [Streptomyces sp. 2132.2]|uniref:DUF6232 family protein n=1 Tax=Streptomyces sp. 2132.2 TaxID=2485161 RepID=UPI000FAD5333|nr:DUF6232 family protein [Streptomyces sp. 2132.2]ROQ95857.1 hypothetical protein EDE04_2310 [Streptomyces sp. 2132.2]